MSHGGKRRTHAIAEHEGLMRQLDRVNQLLGGRAVLGTDLVSLPDLIERLRAGLPYEALVQAAKYFGFSAEQAAVKLRLPVRTLARRKQSWRLDVFESERVVRLAAIQADALAAIGDCRRSREWILTDNRALGGVSPLSLLDTDVGARVVEDMLIRAGYGVYG
jgi:putative toxin-antitoxin system antitoxin component (TIGR02293 family)